MTFPPNLTASDVNKIHVAAARRNSAACSSYVMRDEAGKPFRLAPCHREWHALFARHDRIILWGSAELGKCEAAGARIALADGTHPQIETLLGRDVEVILLDPTDMTRRSAPARVTDNGTRRVLHVQLRSGRRLSLTGEHPLFLSNGWTRAESVRVGDMLATSRSLPEPVHYERLSTLEAELLGFFVGDGGTTKDKAAFTNVDPGVIDRVRDLALRMGWFMKPQGKYGFIFPRFKGRRASRATLTAAAFCRKWGIACLAKEKRVPDAIFRAQNEAISLFLGAYFACDGSVTALKKKGALSGQIEWSSASPGMCEDLQLLLLRFGIASTVSKRSTTCGGKRFVSWRLSVCGWDNLVRFRQEIPVVGEKAVVLASLQPPARLSTHDVVPAAWRDMMPRKLRAGDAQRHRFNNRSRRGNNRVLVRKMLAELPCREVELLCSEEVYWDEVLSITPEDGVQTYCVEVFDPAHCYLSSGILSHNSRQLISYIAWKIGLDPTTRVVMVSKNKAFARKIMSGVANVMRSAPYREVFPGVLLLAANGDFINVLGYDGVNHTVEAVQFLASIHGARIDILILDDVLDRLNTRTEHQRESMFQFYKDVYISRLTARGQVIFAANAWHPRDMLHRLQAELGWVCRRDPIWRAASEEEAAEFERQQPDPRRAQYVPDKKSWMISIWPEHWPIDRILARRAEYKGKDELFFRRVYECEPLDDGASTWERAWILRAEKEGLGLPWVERLADAHGEIFRAVVLGVDLATKRPAARRKTDESVITAAGQYHDGRKRLLRIKSGVWHGPQIVDEIKDFRQRFHPAIPWVESVAAQLYIAEFCAQQTTYSPATQGWHGLEDQPPVRVRDPIPVRTFDTTAQKKFDDRFGVEALGTEMSCGIWRFPNRPDVPQPPDYHKLVDGMMSYDSTGHTSDYLMSLWFASEGLRLGSGAPDVAPGANARGR